MEKNLRYTGPEGTPILDTVNKMERLYQVPVAYFEGLADEIMAKIRLGAFSGNMGYQVPEGYFSGLASQIMSRIHGADTIATPTATQIDATLNGFRNPSVEKELASIAPFLLQIGNQNVYTVPAGYFEGIEPLEVTSNVRDLSSTTGTGGKVIALTPKKRIWRSAVAAAAILVVLFSGEHYFAKHHDSNIAPNTGNQFAAKISSDNDSFKSGLSALSDADIMGYLSTPDPALRDSTKEKVTEETQRAISNMTNEELENYLDRTPATY